ncbi:MAG TPA: DinB family protein, partial [Acidobacteriota bacterium]|nr:DinB family protein [Acidobacteriota bacterium]
MKKDDFYHYALDAFRSAETMIKMAPSDKLDWKPAPDFMTVGELLCHLSDGIGSMLHHLVNNSWPQHDATGVMPSCGAETALAGLEKDKTTLRKVLNSLTEEEFSGKTV